MAKLPTVKLELDDLGEKLDIAHIRDLLQAERAGRLVMLPCKVGDTVYQIDAENRAVLAIRMTRC